MAGKFQVYKDKGGEFRFRLLAGNGQGVLVSEGYASKASCLNGVESVRKNALNDAHYERKQAKSGKPMFNLKASNGQVVGTSELYDTELARDQGIESVKQHAPDAVLEDTTQG